MTDKNPLAHYSGVLSEAVQESAAEHKPLFYVSRKQIDGFTLLKGLYIPFRREPEGLFQMAVYAAPVQAARPIEVTDGMAMTFHHAITDGAIGQDDLNEIKVGLQAVLANVTALQAAPTAVAVPDGYAMVPLRLTTAMDEVLRTEGWQWEDLLAAAESITKQQYAALADTPAAAPQTQPVGIDDQTMELAESVGLIGPTSRTHDLHAAIQRFHDLIVVNASIKAAQDFAKELKKFTTAAPVVLPEPAVIATSKRESPVKGSVEFAWGVDALKEEGEHKLFTEQQVRALLATATGLPAQAVKPSGLLTVDEYQAKYLHIHKMSDDERYGYESLYNEIVSGLQIPAAAPQAQAFQQRVQPWMMACFGPEISADSRERNHRFLEEALELVQSCGCTASEAHQLVEYVYGRPWGEPAQEAGGVMVTLAALCLANGLDMHACGETELARIWTKVEAIRAKQAAKPKHSPLPEHAPQAQADARDAELLTDSALLDAMEHQRIALHPEYEGPWDAEVYNDEGEPIHAGSGSTPREAIRAAIAAAKGE